MQYEITLTEVDAVAIGAGILGTGGGGNTYIGRTWLRKELRERGTVCRIIAADDVADDAYVCAIGTMGAPTVGVEKLQNGQEFITAMRAIEAHLRAPLAAILIGEIGGSNALKPLICGLQMNLPIVDGDGMGRAFPELRKLRQEPSKVRPIAGVRTANACPFCSPVHVLSIKQGQYCCR